MSTLGHQVLDASTGCWDSFSDADTNVPLLVAYEDGTQSIFWRQRAVELPTATTWELVQDPETAEWLVDSAARDPGIKPKWVTKLMQSKRSRMILSSSSMAEQWM